jgi:hypothetical protein
MLGIISRVGGWDASLDQSVDSATSMSHAPRSGAHKYTIDTFTCQDLVEPQSWFGNMFNIYRIDKRVYFKYTVRRTDSAARQVLLTEPWPSFGQRAIQRPRCFLETSPLGVRCGNAACSLSGHLRPHEGRETRGERRLDHARGSLLQGAEIA